jgi:hypothetical protein
MLNMDISIHNMLFRPESYTTNTDILHNLQPYMLTTNMLQDTNTISNITKICNNNNIDNKILTTVDESIPCELIVPRHTDSLFWCIYIILNDYEDYLNIHHNHSVKELEWKQSLLHDIKKSPTCIKKSNHKITKAGLECILSDLMTSSTRTGKDCLVAICVYRNINIIILEHDKKVRMEFLSGEESCKTFLLKKTDNKRYSVTLNELSIIELEDINNTTILIDNHEKPLKSIGSYKNDALIDIAKKCNLYNHNQNYKKADLYKLISEYINVISI